MRAVLLASVDSELSVDAALETAVEPEETVEEVDTSALVEVLLVVLVEETLESPLLPDQAEPPN